MKTEPNEPMHMGSQERKYGSEDQFTTTDFFEGLTKREYFAAMAMQGYCASPDLQDEYSRKNISRNEFAEMAVYMADCLINQLNKPVYEYFEADGQKWIRCDEIGYNEACSQGFEVRKIS